MAVVHLRTAHWHLLQLRDVPLHRRGVPGTGEREIGWSSSEKYSANCRSGGGLLCGGTGAWALASRCPTMAAMSGKEEQPRSSAQVRSTTKGESGSGVQGRAGSAVHQPEEVPDGEGWAMPVKVARRSSPSRPSSPAKGSSSGSRFAALGEAGRGAPDPFGGEGSYAAAVGPFGAGGLLKVPVEISPAGRFKRAWPTPKSSGPAVREKEKISVDDGGSLALEGDFMDMMSGQKGQLQEVGNCKGKAPMEEIGREPSEFIFTAGGWKGGTTNLLKPTVQDSDIHPDSALLLSDQAHIVAVDRLRQAIVEDGDRSSMMEDTYEGVDEDREGGGSGVTPLSHQASE